MDKQEKINPAVAGFEVDGRIAKMRAAMDVGSYDDFLRVQEKYVKVRPVLPVGQDGFHCDQLIYEMD